jgi:hypothetical protein
LWYNVVFDLKLPETNNKDWQVLIAYGIPESGNGFEDCYFKVTSGTNTPSAFVFYGIGLGHVFNCIFDFNAIAGNGIYVTYGWNGTHGLRKLKDCVVIDNTVDQTSSVMKSEGTGTSNIGWIDAVNVYRYRNVSEVSATNTLLGSGACAKINTTGANQAKAINPTAISAGSSVTTLINNWSGAWDFSATAIKLCGTTVLSAN